MDNKDNIRVAVRFKEEELKLYQALLKSAKKNKRSLNSEILKAIEYYLKSQKEKGEL